VRIAAASVRRVRLEFRRPVRTARGVASVRETLLLSLTAVDGTTGHGEAAPWPGFGTESIEAAQVALERAAAALVGAEVEPDAQHTGTDAPLHDAPAARAALQGALWDLAARRDGVPLARQLAQATGTDGLAALGAVATHALLLGDTPDDVRTSAEAARVAGFRAAKLKLGFGAIDDDVARARAARDVLGSDVRLRGDANGAWDLERALAALERLAPLGFEFIEQPLPADALEASATLRRRAPVRIALDESAATAADVVRAIEAGAADVVVLKPAFLGGPWRAIEIAGRVRAAGGEVLYTHAMESAVGAHHALHCAAADGDEAAIHGLRTAGLFVADVAAPVDAPHGLAIVPDAPGLGVSP
jgi:o-succinylbenzoate synthase